MTGSSHPRFRLLVGWCCLMSAAILIMIVFLTKTNRQLNTNSAKENVTPYSDEQKETATPYNDKQKGVSPGRSVRSYIRLIWGSWACGSLLLKNSLWPESDFNITESVQNFPTDDQNSWICSPLCENSSLSLKNETLEITVSGLYYIHAQVSFTNPDKSKQEVKETVTLLRNEGNGKTKKKLSEVRLYEEGSVSINRMVHLTNGDSISLIIPESMILLKNDWETYWEIFSL